MSHEPEWLTRKTRIDGRLRALGWDVVPHTPSFRPEDAHRKAVKEYPTANGPADYALFVNGLLLGIIEAKKLSLGPQNVLVQAQRYSEGATGNPLEFGPFRVPFLFSTNGEVIWFHDVRSPLERSRRLSDYFDPVGAQGAARPRLRRRRATPVRSRERSSATCGPTRSRPTPPSSRPSRTASGKCSSRWRPGTGKTFTTGEPGLSAHEVRRRPAHPVPRGSPGTGRPGRAGLRLVRAGAGPEVQQDLRGLQPAIPARKTSSEDEKFDPTVLPTSYLLDPEARPRLRLRLHDSADGDQPVRPRGGLRAGRRRAATTKPRSSTSRSTPST